MSPVRQAEPGATRSCPHCRTTILETASICPACKKYLRFDPEAAARAADIHMRNVYQSTIKQNNKTEES